MKYTFMLRDFVGFCVFFMIALQELPSDVLAWIIKIWDNMKGGPPGDIIMDIMTIKQENNQL